MDNETIFNGLALIATITAPFAAWGLICSYVKSGMKKAEILDAHYQPLFRDNLEQYRKAVQSGNKKEAERLYKERQFMIMEANKLCRDYLTEDGSWSVRASDNVNDIVRKGFNLERCIAGNK